MRASLVRWVFVAYAAWAAFIAVLALIEIGVLDLFRDPTQLDEHLADHPWKGSFSMAGNLAWASAAAMALLTGAVLRTRRDGRAGFFVAMGLIFLALGLDDAFVIHDDVAVLVLGDAFENVVLAALGLLFVAWLVRYRAAIRSTSYVLLALGTLGIGVPVLLDLREAVGLDASWIGVVEEAAELAGIATLLLYVAVESWRVLVPVCATGATAG